MNDIRDLFMTEEEREEREFSRYLMRLRIVAAKTPWSVKELAQFCVEWQEVTGNLLKAAGKPGYEWKLADAEEKKRWRDIILEGKR